MVWLGRPVPIHRGICLLSGCHLQSLSSWISRSGWFLQGGISSSDCDMCVCVGGGRVMSPFQREKTIMISGDFSV